MEKIQGKYFYVTDYKDGDIVVPRLNPDCGNVGVIIKISIVNQHAVSYRVSWANGVTQWHIKTEITLKKGDGVTQH